LFDERQRHAELLDHILETGENLCTMLPGDCRHLLHQQTGALQLKCDQLFTSVMASQRQLEASLVEWTSYIERVSQVETWLAQMRTLVSDDLPLVASLDEKKEQLQSFKVIIYQLYCARKQQ